MQLIQGVLRFGWFLGLAIIIIKKVGFKKSDNLILAIAFLFALMAFFQKVSDMSDLSEAFGYLNGIREYGFSYFQNPHYTIQNYFSGKIGLQVYFYLMSLLPYNNFYSAISMFLMYYLLFKSIQIVVEYYELEKKMLKEYIIVLILIINFYNASNGVRNMLTFSIFVYGIVLDIYKEKKVTAAILYLIAVSIHPSVAVLIGLRYLYLVKNRFIKLLIGFVLLLWANGLNGLLAILQPFSSIGFISVLCSKITYYSMLGGSNENFGEAFNTSGSYLMMRYFRIFWVVLILCIAIVIIRKIKEQKGIATFSFYLGMFSLGTLPSIFATNVFSRYSVAVFMITPILLCQYQSLDLPKKKLQIGSTKFDLLATCLCIGIVLILYYNLTASYCAFGLTGQMYS